MHRPSRFLADRHAFTGAEKALMITFGLAIVVLIGALLRKGSEKAGNDARTTLSQGLSAGPALGQVVQQPPQAIMSPQAIQAPTATPQGPGLFQRVGDALQAAWAALPALPKAPDPSLISYPDGSSIRVVRDQQSGAVTGLQQQDAGGKTLAWRLDQSGVWRAGPTLAQANRPVGSFTVQVGADHTITTDSATERFTRAPDGTTTILSKATGVERRVAADGTISIGKAGADPVYRLTPGAGGEIQRITDVRRSETWTRTATGWTTEAGDTRSEVQITGTKLVWTGVARDNQRALFVEDLRTGDRAKLQMAEPDFAFLKDKHQEFLRLGLLPPGATIADADTLYGAAQQAKNNLALSQLNLRRMRMTALSIGRRTPPKSAYAAATGYEIAIRNRMRMVDQRFYLGLSQMGTVVFTTLDRQIDNYQAQKPTTAEIASAAGESALLKVGDIFDGVVEHPLRTGALVVATVVAPEVMIPVLVTVGGASAGYQIGIGAQTVYTGYQSNNHAQIYQGISHLSAGTIDLALTVAAAKAPAAKGSTAAQAELETALARNLNLSADGLSRQAVMDALARRFPVGKAGEGVSLEEQVLQHAADQLARMKGWDPVVVRLKSAPDLSPPAGPPRGAPELAKALGLPENATQSEALAALFKRFPRLRGTDALELTSTEAAALRDVAELARLKGWKTELVLKVEEGAVPPPGQGVLPGGTRPALPPPATSGPALARLSEQAKALGDGVGQQKLGALGRESAAGVGDGLKAEFLEALQQRAAAPENAGKSIHQLMQDEIAANPGKYTLKGDLVSLAELQKQGAFSRVIGLESVFRYHLTDAAKAQFAKQGITTAEAFADAVAKDPQLFDAATMLDKGSTISGKNGVAWWSPRGESKAGTLPELVDELALDAKYYKGGAIRVSVDPAAASKLGFRKPTALDGVPFKEWVEAPPGSPIGYTGGGKPEAVAPGIRLGDGTEIQFFH